MVSPVYSVDWNQQTNAEYTYCLCSLPFTLQSYSAPVLLQSQPNSCMSSDAIFAGGAESRGEVEQCSRSEEQAAGGL